MLIGKYKINTSYALAIAGQTGSWTGGNSYLMILHCFGTERSNVMHQLNTYFEIDKGIHNQERCVVWLLNSPGGGGKLNKFYVSGSHAR